MKKFLLQQAVQSLNIKPDNPLYSIIPTNNKSTAVTILNFCSSSAMTLEALHFHEKKLETISSFANNGNVNPVPPLYVHTEC